MPIILTFSGELRNLRLLLAAQDQVLHLFQNDLAISRGTVLAQFVECDWSGYLPQTYPAASWTPPALEGQAARSIGIPATFTHNGGPLGNLVYGYWFQDSATAELTWCERLQGAPIIVQAGSPPLIIIPSYSVLGMFP